MSWSSAPDAGTKRRSPALMITGYSLAGVGTAGMVTGAVMMATSERIEVQCFEAPCGGGGGRGPNHFIGRISLLAGGSVTAVGLGLGIWGTLRVHGDDDESQSTSSLPRVRVGPASVAADWRF